MSRGAQGPARLHGRRDRDRSASAAALAEQHAERVIVGDAEKIDYATELAGEEFDVVLFADVLEHLKEPADVLRRVRPFVAENGVVVASIPNIAHAQRPPRAPRRRVPLPRVGPARRHAPTLLHARVDPGSLRGDRIRGHALAPPAARRRRDRDQGATGPRGRARVARLRSRGDDVPVRRCAHSSRSRASQLKTMREELEELRPHRDAATQLAAAARGARRAKRPLREEVASAARRDRSCSPRARGARPAADQRARRVRRGARARAGDGLRLPLVAPDSPLASGDRLATTLARR